MLIGSSAFSSTPQHLGVTQCRGAHDGKWSRTVALLQGIQAIPKGMALPMMSQEALVLAFQKLFPALMRPGWQIEEKLGMVPWFRIWRPDP